MDQMLITPSLLHGTVAVPPSKSGAHRAILCAALSDGVSRISPVALSDDIRATIGAVQALGAVCTFSDDTLTVDARGMFTSPAADIDCMESGSTLRFLLPIAAAGGVCTAFTGHGRLPERPVDAYEPLFEAHGVHMSASRLPLTVSGQLRSDVYELPGDISSQYITGLLLALPLLEGDSEIRLTTQLESSGYIDMTLACMRQFGVTAVPTASGYHIPGGQRYVPCDTTVEGDWSQAAFFLAAGALGGQITLPNLSLSSCQGDRAALTLFERFGACLKTEGGVLQVERGTLEGMEIDASQIPDMVPALAVTAACARGETRITGAARLRIKESDRIQSVCAGLRAMQIEVEELPDGMIIRGGQPKGGRIDCFGDHRIAMAFSVLAAYADGASVLDGASCVTKSYPDFFEVFRSIGGKADVIHR